MKKILPTVGAFTIAFLFIRFFLAPSNNTRVPDFTELPIEELNIDEVQYLQVHDLARFLDFRALENKSIPIEGPTLLSKIKDMSESNPNIVIVCRDNQAAESREFAKALLTHGKLRAKIFVLGNKQNFEVLLNPEDRV